MVVEEVEEEEREREKERRREPERERESGGRRGTAERRVAACSSQRAGWLRTVRG